MALGFDDEDQKAMADGFGLRRRGCRENDEKDYSSKVIRTIRFALLLLRLFACFHSEKRSLACAVGGVEIPTKILSLQLPPNKIRCPTYCLPNQREQTKLNQRNSRMSLLVYCVTKSVGHIQPHFVYCTRFFIMINVLFL